MTGFAGHEHLFVGEDPLRVERHWRILNNIQFHYGRCWPLDLALWDLAGKIAGPAGLAAARRAVRPRAGLCLVGDAARRRSRWRRRRKRYLARGFRGLKIRFHRGDWRDDIKALEAVRARIGDEARADGGLQSGLAHEP